MRNDYFFFFFHEDTMETVYLMNKQRSFMRIPELKMHSEIFYDRSGWKKT